MWNAISTQHKGQANDKILLTSNQRHGSAFVESTTRHFLNMAAEHLREAVDKATTQLASDWRSPPWKLQNHLPAHVVGAELTYKWTYLQSNPNLPDKLFQVLNALWIIRQKSCQCRCHCPQCHCPSVMAACPSIQTRQGPLQGPTWHN